MSGVVHDTDHVANYFGCIQQSPRAYFLSSFAGIAASSKTEQYQGTKTVSALIRMQKVLLS